MRWEPDLEEEYRYRRVDSFPTSKIHKNFLSWMQEQDRSSRKRRKRKKDREEVNHV